MIIEEKCYTGICDNCGEIFIDGEYILFLWESDVKERMGECDWYANGVDPDHKGKDYCPDCFKYDEDVDDKIIVDQSRFKPQQL